MRVDPHHLGERKFLEYPLFLSADTRARHQVLHVAICSLLVTALVVATAAVVLG